MWTLWCINFCCEPSSQGIESRVKVLEDTYRLTDVGRKNSSTSQVSGRGSVTNPGTYNKALFRRPYFALPEWISECASENVFSSLWAFVQNDFDFHLTFYILTKFIQLKQRLCSSVRFWTLGRLAVGIESDCLIVNRIVLETFSILIILVITYITSTRCTV